MCETANAKRSTISKSAGSNYELWVSEIKRIGRESLESQREYVVNLCF